MLVENISNVLDSLNEKGIAKAESKLSKHGSVCIETYYYMSKGERKIHTLKQKRDGWDIKKTTPPMANLYYRGKVVEVYRRQFTKNVEKEGVVL